jgi:hypothetical protein
VTFLEANLRALADRAPAAGEALAVPPREGSGGLLVEPTTSGAPTARLEGLYVHGRHDPRRDSDVQVRREIDSSCTAIVAIGFGLGYGPEAARRAFPERPLLVVEPDAALFREALAARDLRRLLEDPGVRFHIGASPDTLPGALESLPLARPAFLRLRPALRARPAAYRPFEETIQSWLLRRDININTLNRFGRLWVRNLCRNMTEFLRCPGVDLLKGLFDGVPALVVAGGPSLDSIAGSLADLSQRMLVVCVNTSARACRQHGVEPDFTVVVDPQFWASRSLDWTLASRGVLVAEPSACPRVFRRSEEMFFLCSSLFPLGEALEEAVGQKGTLGAGGSVSTSAWDLARLLGARPLYAAGLDLGFPGMRAHCRGAYPEGMWLAGSHRLSTLEGSAFAAVRDIGLFPARSTDGNTTPTDRRMLLYKWWFENQLRMYADTAARTLSARAVAIEGMPLAGVEQCRALPVVRPGIDERMHKVRQIHETPGDQAIARERLTRSLRELCRQLAELEELAARGRARSRDLGSRVSAGADTRECMADLNGIDEAILAVSARGIAGFLIQSIIHGLLGEGGRLPDPAEVVARSDAVYAGIAESAAWQRRLLERAAGELDTS